MPQSGVFVVTDDLRKTLDNLPAANPRSRLEPFRSFILRWRREGRSYRNIQRILADECHVSVTHRAIIQFVKLRSRPRKPQPELDLEPLVSKPAAQTEAKPPVRPFTDQAANSGKMSPEEFAEQVARMKALKAQPVVQTVAKKRYEYNPDEPLTLERKKDE